MCADLLTQEQLDKQFPTPTTLVGPAMLVEAKIFGRNITKPLLPAVETAARYMPIELFERVLFAAIKQWGSSASVPAKDVRVNKRTVALDTTAEPLPTPPSLAACRT
jgi:hypothetical protein